MSRAKTAATGPLRAAIYARVSTDEQRDNTSLGSQEATCRRYVEDQGWTLDADHVFHETYSGAYLGRTELERLRDLIDRRAIDRVVVAHSDRFGRDPEDRIYLRVEGRQRGVEWVSVADPVGSSPEDRLLDYVSGWAAGLERRSFARRSQAGLRARVASGKRMVGCKPPFGFKWSEERDANDRPVRSGLVIHEPEAAIIRRAIREVAAGASMTSVAERLNRDGVPTPNAARCKPGYQPIWYAKTIGDWLDNPLYTGKSLAYRTKAELLDAHTGRRVARVKPEEEWIDVPGNAVPAIIDAGTWEKARARRAINRERSPRSKQVRKDALLMGGIARCGFCDRPVHVNRFGSGNTVYRCGYARHQAGCRHEGETTGPSMPVADLDRAVWEAVARILASPNTVKAKLRQMARDHYGSDDVQVTDTAWLDLDRQESNITDAIAQATSSAAIGALTRKLDALAEQRTAIRAKQREAMRRHLARQDLLARSADFDSWCAKERAELTTMDFDAKRARLEWLEVSVKVYRPGTPEFRWTLELRLHGITLPDTPTGTRVRATEEHTPSGW